MTDFRCQPVIANYHIAWFKRFAASYMRWVNFNFDRIVAGAVKRHTESQP